MEWTTEAPTKNGWFWGYERLDELTAEVFLLYVDVEFSKQCYGERGHYDISDFQQWQGPVKLPQRPYPPNTKMNVDVIIGMILFNRWKIESWFRKLLGKQPQSYMAFCQKRKSK